MHLFNVALCAALCSFAVAQDAQERVPVAVYYESLCPDSIKFFTKQLYPVLQTDLGKYVNLTLIPYGKSEQKFVNGENEFTCHHGPDECDGNMAQACALAKIDNGHKSLNLGYNKILVGYINCLMEKVQRTPYSLPAKECAQINNVPGFEDLETCRKGGQGKQLLSNLGYITGALTPKLQSVPTVVFRGKYNEEDNAQAQVGFAKTLCNKIANKPDNVCRTYSGADGKSVTMSGFALVGAVVLFYLF